MAVSNITDREIIRALADLGILRQQSEIHQSINVEIDHLIREATAAGRGIDKNIFLSFSYGFLGRSSDYAVLSRACGLVAHTLLKQERSKKKLLTYLQSIPQEYLTLELFASHGVFVGNKLNTILTLITDPVLNRSSWRRVKEDPAITMIVKKPLYEISGQDYFLLREWFEEAAYSPASTPSGNKNYLMLQVLVLVGLVKATNCFSNFKHLEEVKPKEAAQEICRPSLAEAESIEIRTLLSSNQDQWGELSRNKGFKVRLRAFLARELRKGP